jgi:acetyl-CoA carboxylase biotin carboxyl carrier protein
VTTTSEFTATGSQEHESGAQPYGPLTDAVRDLVKVMRDGGIGQLDVRQGDLRISLKSARFMDSEQTQHEPAQVTPVAEPDPVENGVEVGHIVTSPMIGTYYHAPGPNERPFVEVGEHVEAGQTVAIIEAMKIMNEIVAERSGTVSEIFVKNGEAVEYGHRLMRLK